MQCQLCGYEFNTKAMKCHGECPMGSHCNLVCCPNCGYQVVDESKSSIANFFISLWPTLSKKAKSYRKAVQGHNGEKLVPLTHIAEGKSVQVKSMADMTPNSLNKLSTFGLVPGGTVKVLQHRPAPIIQVDQTELTLSEDILAKIWVNL